MGYRNFQQQICSVTVGGREPKGALPLHDSGQGQASRILACLAPGIKIQREGNGKITSEGKVKI